MREEKRISDINNHLYGGCIAVVPADLLQLFKRGHKVEHIEIHVDGVPLGIRLANRYLAALVFLHLFKVGPDILNGKAPRLFQLDGVIGGGAGGFLLRLCYGLALRSVPHSNPALGNRTIPQRSILDMMLRREFSLADTAAYVLGADRVPIGLLAFNGYHPLLLNYWSGLVGVKPPSAIWKDCRPIVERKPHDGRLFALLRIWQ